MPGTRKRICLVNKTIKDGDKEFKLKKDKEYITSDILDSEYLIVFSYFFAHNIPVKWFTTGKKYTD